MSLFAELKRRNVFKVGAAYLVVGWVIIEVASTIAPQLNLPEWAPRLVTFLILLGFPISLVLAWIFDMTPGGVQVTESRSGSAAFYGVVALIVVASVGGFLFWGGETSTSNGTAAARGQSSIAVLPFVNMSADAENEFFADGISEELLNILAGIEGLDVASRTSAFSFKGKDTPIPEIARLLGVRHVLEGSVRRQGTRVRITAQLIDAERDVHLWSDSYDRDLTDIFEVQEEIAQAITDALQDILGTRQVAVQASTDDLEAYEHFLRGRTNFYQRLNLDQAIDDLEFATERDPEFAEAWAFLAAARYVTSFGGYPTRRNREELREIVDEPAGRALALRPESSLALAVRGARLIDGRTPDGISNGIALLRRAAANESHDTTARIWLGFQLLVRGRIEEALPVLEDAYRTDPLVAINTGYLGFAYFLTGREEDGLDLVRRATEMSRWGVAAMLLSLEFANRGELELAGELYERAISEMGIPESYGSRMVESYRRAITDPSARAANRALRDEVETILGGPMIGEWIAYGPSGLDDAHWPTAGVFGEHMMIIMAAWMPSVEWMRESPGFYRFAEHYGHTAYWAEYGYPLDCRLADGPGEPHLDCGGAD